VSTISPVSNRFALVTHDLSLRVIRSTIALQAFPWLAAYAKQLDSASRVCGGCTGDQGVLSVLRRVSAALVSMPDADFSRLQRLLNGQGILRW